MLMIRRKRKDVVVGEEEGVEEEGEEDRI